jgi:hypothetical protein
LSGRFSKAQTGATAKSAMTVANESCLKGRRVTTAPPKSVMNSRHFIAGNAPMITGGA